MKTKEDKRRKGSTNIQTNKQINKQRQRAVLTENCDKDEKNKYMSKTKMGILIDRGDDEPKRCEK
jgi:hypothetical protein